MVSIVTIWERSATAELSWISPSGPVGVPVVPLVWEGRPCVALPFAHLALVDTLTDGRAAFSVTDARVLPAGLPAAVATGAVSVTHDLSGELFTADLLAQEVRKHPPTRLRADGLMARRENWWWVPRVIVTLTDTAEVRRLHARTRSADAVVVRGGEHGPVVDVVTAREWPARPGSRTELWRRDGGALDAPQSPAYVFSHHHSPDFERWERWHRAGVLDREVLTVTAAAGTPTVRPRPNGVWARLRNHRDVERACRRGIAAAESRARLR